MAANPRITVTTAFRTSCIWFCMEDLPVEAYYMAVAFLRQVESRPDLRREFDIDDPKKKGATPMSGSRNRISHFPCSQPDPSVATGASAGDLAPHQPDQTEQPDSQQSQAARPATRIQSLCSPVRPRCRPLPPISLRFPRSETNLKNALDANWFVMQTSMYESCTS